MTREPDTPAACGLVGRVFGRLTVTAPAARRNGRQYVEARCSCGNTKTVGVSRLRTGDTKSCGCLMRDGGAGRLRIVQPKRVIVQTTFAPDSTLRARVTIALSAGPMTLDDLAHRIEVDADELCERCGVLRDIAAAMHLDGVWLAFLRTESWERLWPARLRVLGLDVEPLARAA